MEDLIKGLVNNPEYIPNILPEMVSADESDVDRTFVALMHAMIRKGIAPSYQSVRDQLLEWGEDSQHLLAEFDTRMEAPLVRDLDYMIHSLRDRYNKRILLHVFNEGMKLVGDREPDSVRLWAETEMKKLANSVSGVKEHRRAVDQALKRFKSVYNGAKQDIHVTGHESIDRYCPFTKRQITVLAAKQKAGKTRFVLNLVRRMLERNDKLHCHWMNFECSEEEMIAMSIAMKTGISTNVVRGRTRMPSDSEFIEIMNAANMIAEDNITWYGKRMGIEPIHTAMGKLGENDIIVLDNLGLVVPIMGMTETQFDNQTAAVMKELRDDTGACIIVLHHFNKAQEHYSRKADFFEPSVNDVRGSARIVDYANQTLMIHRISMFQSLQESFKPDEWETLKKRLQLIVPDGRDGGDVSVKFEHQLECCRFNDLGIANGVSK